MVDKCFFVVTCLFPKVILECLEVLNVTKLVRDY